MLTHKPYNKIEETSTKWSNDYKKVKEWAVTEKVHGSNFSFVYNVNENEMKYAKRNGLIANDEHFFNYQSILPDTNPKIMHIVHEILEENNNKNQDINQNKNIKKIIVFGELFGGVYPNMKTKFKQIQAGIYYSPNIHFIAFDIYIEYDNSNISNYLDFATSIQYLKNAKLLYVEPLAIFSSYEKACFYKLGFNTTIPAKLGLPELPVNKAEGIVIRSMTDRFIIKKKILEFSETIYSDNSVKTGDKKSIGMAMLTENRLNNAISKVGELDNYRYQIYELLVQDILYELDVKDGAEKKILKTFFMEQVKKKFD